MDIRLIFSAILLLSVIVAASAAPVSVGTFKGIQLSCADLGKTRAYFEKLGFVADLSDEHRATLSGHARVGAVARGHRRSTKWQKSS